MIEPGLPFRSAGLATNQGPLRSVPDVIERAQRLVDSQRPVGGHPVDWLVEAQHVGDLTAIAAATLRERGPAATRERFR